MGQHVLPGNPPITVSLRRLARARRLSLRISRLDGRVVLTLPSRLAAREAVAFLKEREDWLRGHLSRIGAAETPIIGGVVPYRGADLPILAGAVRRATPRDGALLVPDAPERVAGRVQAFLKAQARDALVHASDTYAAQIGRSYSRITLRDTRSRWGSCSSDGALMYSWRLIMAPPEVLDYVAAHEVAHLVEMNHSPAFWALVERLCPAYAIHRRWLREHGDRLMRVQF